MRQKLYLAVVGVVFVLGVLTVYWWFQADEPAQALDPSAEAVHVLALGLDNVGEAQRTDTILVARLEPDAIKILSIPRDLRVTFPDGSTGKVNAAYGRGGVELVRRTLADRLGIAIQGHVLVDYAGFRRIIDALGGVPITVEQAMTYEDTAQDLVIDIEAGQQTLSGGQALDYWRYRDAATRQDLGRIERQHKFLNAVVEQATGIEGSERIRSLVRTVLDNVRTDIAFVDAFRLAQRYRDLSPEAVRARTLPGTVQTTQTEDGATRSYYVADPVETAAVVAEFFQGREVLTNSDVRVIVLNGHPNDDVRPQLALRTSNALREQGFEIVGYWNADAFDYPESFLINVSGNERKAELLASSLGEVPVQVVSPEGFAQRTEERFGSNRLEAIRRILMTTAIPPDDRGLELQEADCVLILGGEFRVGPIRSQPDGPADGGANNDTQSDQRDGSE